MNGKVLPCVIIALLFVSAAMTIVPFAYSQKPVINSHWTDNPPNIDGKFLAGEWSNLQITFSSTEYPSDYVLPTYAYFLNDGSNLYVLVDTVGDTTDDSPSDECLLIFDNNSDPTDGFTVVRIQGSSDPMTWIKSSDDFDAAIGYGSSPNSPDSHKIYEFAIPFTYINTQPGQSFDFCSPFWKSPLPSGSMPFDSNTNYDNVWPQGLGKDTDVWRQNADGWGIITTGAPAVGGHLVPMNKLVILSPYFALGALTGAILSIMIRRTRK
jgi:hypothetical protein